MQNILIMYHLEDKTFWGYDGVSDIDPGSRLVKLGDKCTDIAVKYPPRQFTQARLEKWEQEKLAKAKLRPKNRRQRYIGRDHD